MSRPQEDPQSGVAVLHEISSLLLKILRSPPQPVPFSDHVLELSSVISSSSRILPSSQMTPAGFASLLLGISLALMLCGSVTFFLGFMLMPWILVLAMVFYVVGIVSSLSMLGRSMLCCFTVPTPRKDFECLETNVNMKNLWFNQIVELFARGWSAWGLQGNLSKDVLVNDWCCL